MNKTTLHATLAGLTLLTSPALHAEQGSISFSASVGIEYDNNISVSALDTRTGESDEALVLDLSASYMLFEDEKSEVELNYDFYQSAYSTFDDFDLQIHTLSAFGSTTLNDLDLGLAYSYSMVDLGSEDLYASHSLTPSVGVSVSDSWYARASYTLLNKDFDTAAGRDADQHGAGLDNYIFFNDNGSYVSLSLGVQDEDAKDAELDYRSTYLNTAVTLPLQVAGSAVRFKGKYERYWRDYDNLNTSIGAARRDRNELVGLNLIKAINDRFDVVLNYEYTNTRSNLSSVDDEEHILTLSLAAEF